MPNFEVPPSELVLLALFIVTGGKWASAKGDSPGAHRAPGAAGDAGRGPTLAPVQQGGQLRWGWPAVANKVTLQIHQDSLHLHGGLQEQIISCTTSVGTLGSGVRGSHIASAHLFATRACLDL